MNKKIIFLIFLIIVFFSVISIVLAIKKPQNEADTLVGSNIAIMVQNSTNNDKYDRWDNETWPSNSEYQFNVKKSSCNGNESVGSYVSYTSNNITLNNAKENFKCNLYFDRKKEELSITGVSVDNNTPYTLILTVNATGGSGGYTYSVENSCYTECDEVMDSCAKDTNSKVEITPDGNKITISNLKECAKHKFKVKVKDSNNNEVTYDVTNNDVKAEHTGVSGLCSKVCTKK